MGMTDQKYIRNKRRCHWDAYHPSHQGTRRTWRLSPVGIINDCIIIIAAKHEDMSEFIIGFRFLFGNFNFCWFIFYLFIFLVFTRIWVFIFIFTSFMRLIWFISPVSFLLSVAFLGKCWCIRDFLNVFLDTLTEQRGMIRTLTCATHNFAELWASFGMY